VWRRSIGCLATAGLGESLGESLGVMVGDNGVIKVDVRAGPGGADPRADSSLLTWAVPRGRAVDHGAVADRDIAGRLQQELLCSA